MHVLSITNTSAFHYFCLDRVIIPSDLHNLFCSISLDKTSFNAASTLEPLRANPILLAAVKVNPSLGMLRFCLTIHFCIPAYRFRCVLLWAKKTHRASSVPMAHTKPLPPVLWVYVPPGNGG